MIKFDINKFLTILFLFICVVSCTRVEVKNVNAENKHGVQETRTTKVLTHNSVTIYKQPVIRGRILYGSNLKHSDIDSLEELLVLYTDDELLSVTILDIAGQNLQEIDSLDKLPNLQDLTLLGCGITSMKGIEKAPNLRSLNLSSNPIEKIEYLEYVPEIESIFLANTRISKIEGIEGLQRLRELILSGNRISTIEGLGNLPSLEWLCLSDNQIIDYTGLLEIQTVNEIVITSLDNIIDDSAIEILSEWNRRFPEQAFKW